MESSEYTGAGSQSKIIEESNPKGESSEHERSTVKVEDIDKETEKEIFENLKYDFKKAKEAKAEIDDLIADWNDVYDGKTYGNELKTRSSIVLKDVAKQLEWQKPNLTEPFTATSKPIQAVPLNPRSVKNSKISQAYLNYEFTAKFNRYKFMNDVADVFGREGTVWVRTGWDFREEQEEKVLSKVSMERIMAIPDQPSSIEQNQDGTFNATYTRPKLTRNSPTVKVCRNEDIFPDPGADSKEELNFMCYRYEETLGELYEAGVYREDALDRLKTRISRSQYEESSLGVLRDNDLELHGKDRNYQSKNPTMQRVQVIEYWGYYDMDGSGIPTPIVAVWADKQEILLRLEENPLPGKRIPFHYSPYASRPFSLWGNALAYYIADNQKVRSMITRGMIDNMSLANNGQKFIQRGALDYVQFKRMTNGERYIQTNLDAKVAITDGSFNQLPQSAFNMMSMFTQETQELSGINSSTPALNTQVQNKTATGAMAQTTMSQQRMADAVRNLASMMKGVFEDWIAYAKDFVEPIQMVEMFGDYVQLTRDDLQGDYDIAIKVTTEMNKQTQIQQLNLMMQQAQAIGEGAPPQAINKLVAEMLDLFDKPGLAEEFRNYQPQPNPMAIQQQQLELAKLQAEIGEIRARTQYEFMYKQAQSKEKLAKADGQDMTTMLDPQKLATETALKNKELEYNAIQSMISGGKDQNSQNPR